MLFCTREYVLFLTAVVILYWLTPWRRPRVWILLIASFVFYASWNKWLAVVVTATSAADYLIARAMDATDRPRRRKSLMIASVVMNVGLLCYFKYTNFFLESLADALNAVGASYAYRPLSIILPVGISFYTFEAINYSVDVYRGKMRAVRQLDYFLLFILFFPHLVAGPIVRAKDFLPQVSRPKRWSWSRAGLGLGLLAIGAFKKLAIADRMGLYVDPIFANPDRYSTEACWTGAIAFVLQVYCDFSGYSDMALGSAHLLGYKLVINFRMPLLSANMSEFWRRWHISLSTWLRDYLFIPLGGSRHGFGLTVRNLLLTMAIAGLWHGASWSYVVWGVFQGLLLVGHRVFQKMVEPLPKLRALLLTPPGTTLRIAFTFLMVTVSFVVFRAVTLTKSGEILARMFAPAGGLPVPLLLHGFWVSVLFVVVGHAIGRNLSSSQFHWQRMWAKTPPLVLGAAAALLIVAAVVLQPGATRAFIYFQF